MEKIEENRTKIYHSIPIANEKEMYVMKPSFLKIFFSVSLTFLFVLVYCLLYRIWDNSLAWNDLDKTRNSIARMCYKYNNVVRYLVV